MRANKDDEKAFTTEISKLRIISTRTRNEFHDKLINWVDTNYMLDASTADVLTFVLPTRGCKYALAWHGGCTMCTLPTDNPLNPTDELIESFPERAMRIFEEKGGKERFKGVKFYTSGSFIDPWQIPETVRDNILRKFVDVVDEITIETRCEFVNRKHIEGMLSVIPADKLIVAIGQETTDDEINRRSINKGHTLAQFERAVKLLHEYKVQVKGYILLKPIFISERQAYNDAISSAEDMKRLGVQNISINPSYIGKGTLMDELFKQKNYQPPWLWTVLNVTRRIKQMVGDDVRVISDPVAAGSSRGPRNCGSCDKQFKSTLKKFSSTQNISLLEELKCDCEEVYNAVMMTEHISNGHGIANPFIKI